MSSRLRLLLAYRSRTGSTEDPFGSLLPVGLMSIHATLCNKGYDSRLANFSGMPWQKVETILRRERPDILFVSQLTHNRHEMNRLAQLARQLDPECFVVMGGPHASACSGEILADNVAVDAVVIGEGEETAAELVRCRSEHGDLGQVGGLVYRYGDEVVTTRQRLPIENLDSLPIPARFCDASISVDIRRQLEFIITSRGCPAACTFCSSPTFWGRSLRFRSPRSIVDEMMFIRDRYGLLYFSIRDDTFTADRERAMEFCRLLISERLYVLWSCQSRVSAVDEELLGWMKRAGCEAVQFGVESGSIRILRVLGKKITSAQVQLAAQAVRRVGLNLSIYLITGVPDEGEADIADTMRLVRNIIPMDGQVSPLAYYPGTALFQQAVSRGTVDRDLFRSSQDEALFARTDSYAKQSVQRLLDCLTEVAAISAYAIRDYQTQKELLGYCHSTNILAGESCEANGDLAGAEKEYGEIARREPDNPWGWLALGNLYGEIGRIREAIAAFEKVTFLVPSHLPAYEALEQLYRTAGDKMAANSYKTIHRKVERAGWPLK